MFYGISAGDFNRSFKNTDDCKSYLYNIKWRDGFQCLKCGFGDYNKGKMKFNVRCKCCGYEESVTANTIFHKIKFPLLKAFGMAFRISVRKKGMSTLELSREFSVNKKSAWLFKRKMQEAMKGYTEMYDTGSREIFQVW